MRASDASYLAGFLDGDGSIHFQLVRQKEYRFGYYIRASLSFSQHTSARHGLEQLQVLVGGGYLRDRGTGMSDLVVTSRPRRLNVQEFLRVAREVDAFATLNYSKTKRISAVDVEQHLRSMGVLTPVTTSLAMLDQRDGFPPHGNL
jgi:hypothetical protein